MTANSYVEDLSTKPFNKTKFNFQQYRLCNFKDYLRIGDESYIQGVLDATGSFAEHCVGSWDGM